MTDKTLNDSRHFTKTVAHLGESRPVIAARAIFNARGIKIIEQGVAISLGLYERLMQHELLAPLEDSVATANTVNGQALRSTAEEAIRDTPFFLRMSEDLKVRSVLLEAIEKIPLPDPIAFQLTLARELHPEVYLHSVQMALMAGWLALEPMGTRFDIGMAAAAGLLHDLGMLHVEPLLLEPSQLLDTQQQRHLYAHPLVSKALIERHHVYSREVVRAVHEHHEFLDGSGYPNQLAGSSISNLGRILSLANVVTAMFDPRREAGEMRASLILRMNAHRFDPTAAAKVLRLLKPEHDRLSTGMMLWPKSAGRLYQINALITTLTAELARLSRLTGLRRQIVSQLSMQLSQLNHALVSAGADPAQLEQLDSNSEDERLKQDLSLLAVEATWQLRALTRQTKRQWPLALDEAYPAELEHWLDQVDALTD